MGLSFHDEQHSSMEHTSGDLNFASRSNRNQSFAGSIVDQESRNNDMGHNNDVQMADNKIHHSGLGLV